MRYYRAADMAKLKRQRTELAINLAMQSRWDEAVLANRSILRLFPTDVDAYNRLGKALTELGYYTQARDAYRRALETDSTNTIAKRNLERLALLTEEIAPLDVSQRVDPRLFVEETGKTTVTPLHQLAPKEVLARVTPGDPVYLKPRGRALVVEDSRGQYLGQIESKLGLRLIRLIEGGNQYEAAIAGSGDNGGRVIIREVFQHPSQAGRISFPPKGADGFRPYVKERLVRHEEEEGTEGAKEEEEEDYSSYWEEGEESLPADMHIYSDETEEEEEIEEQ
ncbi:MAG: tetratricopeptide repeat protein [Chloroflexi bacterium]|nr:tetratricopeptide repeat protein [Chloroflexota bacterium]